MGLSFLAPFLLAGTALISVPWLLHHIRRPERETVPFSSLLFVPNVKKEVIERRRIQHLLLMLLRMLLFFILFFAFARPFWSSVVKPELDDQSSIQFILLDNSYSMGMDGRFDLAKQKAEQIIDSLSINDYVVLISFSRNSQNYLDWELGQISAVRSQERAKEHLATIQISNESTRLIAALQEAEKELLNMIQGIDDKEPKLKIHMISDFQREGTPKEKTSWKLSSKIELSAVYVNEDEDQPVNYSILDSTVRDQTDTYRIIAKIKNWTVSDETVPVDLWLNGELSDSKDVHIKAGNASQIFFTVPKEMSDRVWGWLEINDDSLSVDNRHYFVRNPTKKQTVRIISSKVDQPSSAAWFVYQALTHSEQLPWKVETITAERVNWNEVDSESITILCDWAEVGDDFISSFVSKIVTGSKAIVMLGDTMSPDGLNKLLSYWKLESQGLSVEKMNPRNFQLLSWMDFQHPVFEVFQGQKFNDFSTIRFYRYHQLQSQDNYEQQVIARFETNDGGDKYPALIDINDGDGRVILMPYAMQLDFTNFPKSKKFVPVLHEMLSYLQGDTSIRDSWLVGDRFQLPPPLSENTESVVIQKTVNEEFGEVTWNENQNNAYTEPEIYHWKTEDTDEEVTVSYAVNLYTNESDLNPIARDEFLLRFCAAPNLEQDSLPDEGRELVTEEIEHKNEYGIFMMIAFFGFVMFEMWYASQLT